jgi:uncharacterized protein YukE
MGDAAAFEGAIGRFDGGMDKLRELWDDLVRGIDRVLGHLPSMLAGKLRDMFAELAAKVAEMFTNMVKFATERGSASAVTAAGDSWNTDVGGRASTQSGLLAEGVLATDNSWDGDAADRYREAITTQGRALTQLKTITDTLQSTLNEIASAMTVYWIGMAVAIAAYIVAMAATAIACAGVATAPAGIVAGIAATVTVIGAAATLSIAFDNTLTEKKAKLDQLTTTENGFASKDWPSAVTDRMTEWIPK